LAGYGAAWFVIFAVIGQTVFYFHVEGVEDFVDDVETYLGQVVWVLGGWLVWNTLEIPLVQVLTLKISRGIMKG